MSALQAIVIAILQGATELFPVSSLGHAVVLPALLHWPLDQRSPEFLPFLVMLHLGTATALLLFFWRDWWSLATGVLGSGVAASDQREPPRVPADRGRHHPRGDRRLPAGEIRPRPVRRADGRRGVPDGECACCCWPARSCAARSHRPLSGLTMMDALIIGCWQCTALIPGISRSGATIVGGLLRGIDHEGSAHFSFLIATPIILGATVLEVPHLLHESVPAGTFELATVAAVVAGITAYASTWFLMRYFRQHDAWALNPFAYYCAVIGAGSLLLLLVV